MRFNFALLLVLFACGKEKHYPVMICGHAGNGLTIQNSIYSANSKESVDLALSTLGVEGVEVDVQLSKDGQLWLLHDDDLSVETTSKGCISEKTADELSTIRFKSVHKEKLIRLNTFANNNYFFHHFYLDLRHYNGCTQQVVDVDQFLTALSNELDGASKSHFTILLNYYPWISKFKEQGWMVYAEAHSDEEVNQLVAMDTLVSGVVLRNSFASKELVASLQSKNKQVVLYDMRAPKPIRRALEKLPNVIMTDDIKAALIEKNK